MAHDDDANDIDFVVGNAAAAESDEELPQRSSMRDPRRRWSVVAGALVLAALAAIAGRIQSNNTPAPTPSGTPKSPTPVSSSDAFTPPPDVIGTARVVIPEGNRSTSGRIGKASGLVTRRVSP